MSALLAVLAPVLVGLAVVFTLLPLAHAPRSGRILRTVTGLALGAGLVSTSHAAILFLAASPGAARSTTKDLAFAVLAVLAATVLWLEKRRAPRGSPPIAPPGDPAPVAALWAVAVVSLATVVILLLRTRGMPDGEWDAYGFWNLRARLLLRGAGEGGVVFSAQTTHPDYPLLLPGLTATGWLYAGDGARWVPALEALLWLALLGVALGAAAARLAGSRAACLAVLMLLAAPNVARVASWQYADVPIAALLLLSFTWLVLALREPPEAARPRLVLCGLCVSMAAWTKNEGLAQALALALVVVAIPPAGVVRWKALACFTAGAAPFLALSLAFKASIEAGNDLLAGAAPASLLERVGDPSRYAAIAKELTQDLFRTHEWNLLIPFTLLAPALWRFAGPERERRVVGAALALLGLAYAGVYVLTPMPLAWHLSSSLHRLLLHLYPLLVLTTVVWRTVPGNLRTVPGKRRARS